MSNEPSFICPRDQSFGLRSSFNFAALNKNLLDDFNKRESSILPKDEQMPVYLRIRPLNPGEPQNKVLYVRDATTVLLKPPVMEKSLRVGMFAFGQSSHEFTFNRVFDEATSQDEIFKVVMVERVREFLEGVNGLVFAYGTTSSGKTYSLQGTAGDEGVIPRALECIFRSATLNSTERLVPRGFDEVQEVTEEEAGKRRREKAHLLRLARTAENPLRSCAVSWESVRPLAAKTEEKCSVLSFAYKDSAAFCFWMSFVEIYNEVVYDLLDPNFAVTAVKLSGASSSGVGGSEDVLGGGCGGTFGVRRTPLDLRTDKKGNVFVKGIRWYTVTSAEEAYALVSVGRCCQRVGATKLNESSSRSHSILTLRTLRSRLGASVGAGTGAIGGNSLLSFCDLAGSERCVKAATLAKVQRLREANSINTSLLTLGKCIEALRHNQRRGGCNPRIVPYRESRLTRLFQNFFAAAAPSAGAGGRGRSRACLLVNAAPCAVLADETLHALRFSALAAEVIVSTAAPLPLPPPPPLPPPKEVSLKSATTAAASAVIQSQLRAQLLRQGFHLRCSGSLLGRHAESSVGSAAEELKSDLDLNLDSETKTKTKMGSEEVKVNDAVTMMRRVGSNGDTDGRVDWRPLTECVEKEAKLEQLPREALVEIVRELLATVAEVLPAEVEAVRSETQALVTAAMGEELLRMEEQYESLLQKQERDFEGRLLTERKQRQRRRRLPQLRRRRTASSTDMNVRLNGSPSEGGGEVTEGSTCDDASKTRRMEEINDESEAEAETETEMEERGEEEEEEECLACAHYVKEVARLHEELEEARGDLVDQQDAIAGVMAQRDAFEVKVRRLEFLLQLGKGAWDVDPASKSASTECTTKAVTLKFPSVLSLEMNTDTGMDADADADIIPPTPATTVVAVRRLGKSDGGGGISVEAGGSGSRSGDCLCLENQKPLSSLADVRVDWQTPTPRVTTNPDPDPDPEKQAKMGVKLHEQVDQENVSQMASLLAHEAKVAHNSCCSALSAELLDVRAAHEEALVQIASLQQRLEDYEELQKRCLTMQMQMEMEEKQKEKAEAAKKETLDTSVQTGVLDVVDGGGGKRGLKRRQVERKHGRLYKRAAEAKRELPVDEVVNFSAAEVPELNDSESENALSEQLARNLTQIQVAAVIAKAPTAVAAAAMSSMSESKRRGHRRVVKQPVVVADSSCGVLEGGAGVSMAKQEPPPLKVRRLAPLLETDKFLCLNGGGVTPRPIRRVLRPRKGV